jgi:glycosyltransferase involved in cell wall biosynthesis
MNPNKKIDIIIPCWNSMPELEDCLKSLKPAFGKHLGDIIIVDKHSTDGTINCAYKYGCHIIWEGGTLGQARLRGLRAARTKWVAFIDSDIVLTENWFLSIWAWKTTIEMRSNKLCGLLYGYTEEDIEFIERDHAWKRQMKNNLPRILKIGAFERVYTNNTICLREPLLDAPIENLNAWEDYVMGQWIIEKGLVAVEVSLGCKHLKHGVYEKFGNYTEIWGICGELKAKGWNPRTLCRPFYFVWWGTRCTIHFKDFKYFQYYCNICIRMLKAIFKYRKECFDWSREI